MAEWTALAGVIATGVVGLAGIAAAFFAPAWSQERLERRRELRDFRSARRLVAQELYLAHVDTIVHDKPGALPPDALDFFQTSEWDAHKATLSRELADADYEPVRNAYAEIAAMRTRFTIAPDELDEHERAMILRTGQVAARARDVLLSARPESDQAPRGGKTVERSRDD